MKLRHILTLVATLVLGAVFAPRSHASDFPKGSPAFVTSYDAALKAAKEGGKPLVLVFSASWCPPCESEAPILSAVHRALQKTGEGSVIGVTHVDASADSLAKVRAWNLPYPSLRDVDDKIYKAFGATGPPETYVLDPQGRVVALSRGAITAAFANKALAAAGAKARIDPNLQLGSE